MIKIIVVEKNTQNAKSIVSKLKVIERKDDKKSEEKREQVLPTYLY